MWHARYKQPFIKWISTKKILESILEQKYTQKVHQHWIKQVKCREVCWETNTRATIFFFPARRTPVVQETNTNAKQIFLIAMNDELVTLQVSTRSLYILP